MVKRCVKLVQAIWDSNELDISSLNLKLINNKLHAVMHRIHGLVQGEVLYTDDKYFKTG